MKKIYAIGDIHGRNDLLVMAIDEIKNHSPDGNYITVFTGDYVDRGAQSRQVIDTLMTPPSDGSARICLQGNHEDIMLQASRSNSSDLMNWWHSNGGDWTELSYLEGEVSDKHLDWAKGLPSFYETENYVFVHAYAPQDYVDLDKTEKHLLQWTMYAVDDGRGYRGKHVVHGHVQDKNNPKTIGNRTNIDAFAWYTGKLAVAVFDDDVGGGPIDQFFVKGDTGAIHRQRQIALLGVQDNV